MRRAGLATVLAAASLALTACGASEPAPLTAMQPDAPADLCATVPEATRTGLETSSDTDTSGDPTAACSLRSAPGVSPEVRAVVTWLRVNDEKAADTVLDSQCRAIDRTVFREPAGLSIDGADKTCAGSGKVGSAEAATLAAVAGRTVITVRWSSQPGGAQSVLASTTQVATGLIGSLGEGS